MVWKRLIFHPITILVAIVLVTMLTFSLNETRQTSKKAFEAFVSQEKIIAEKEIELQKITKELKDADDPYYVEKVMRDELLLQNEGEKIIQLPPLSLTEEPPKPTQIPLTPWQEWRQLFFH